jgi:hypothetical protein
MTPQSSSLTIFTFQPPGQSPACTFLLTTPYDSIAFTVQRQACTKRVQKRHRVWIFKGWLVGRLSGPSGATSGRWREMVAEKVSDVGVGAQGLTSADAVPSAKENPTPSTSRGEGGVRRGSRFDSE